MQGEPAGQFLLATLPPSPAQRRLAIAIVLILLAAFAVTAPFRAIQLPKSGAFITAFQTVLFVNDLITATLLFAQFSMLRWQRVACARERLPFHGADRHPVRAHLSRLVLGDRTVSVPGTRQQAGFT